jgi:sugar phosphate isomerase/epimerase
MLTIIVRRIVMLKQICIGILAAACLSAGCAKKNTTVTLDGEPIRIREFPVAMQCWTFREFSFYETLDKVQALGIRYLEAYPGQRLYPDQPDLKMNHLLGEEELLKVREALKERGLALVSYGVVNFENTEEGMRPVFEFAKTMGMRTIVTEPDYDDFTLLEQMAQEYRIDVAVHNHPDPSKYAHPQTVLDHVEGLDRRIGSCADTGHWMRTGVSPLEALKLLEGRIKAVHLKDLNAFGDKEAHDVPYGKGKASIREILAELTRQNYRGFLTVEYENPEESLNPEPSIRKGLDYVKEVTYYQGYEEILGWSSGRYTKHGWNHYGPGYFQLDPESGVLTSEGGMGLFWHSRKMFGDFILELDYQCLDQSTNSGVFLRVPEMVTSDDYIYHSFEIQINDAGEGIHKTGAVYDAEAPGSDAFNETGAWNHFTIVFRENRIQVDLNGKRVIDWEAEPRGKVRDFASEGYVGLQNHDSHTSVRFKNIFIKEL